MAAEIISKRCSKCKQLKPFSRFYKDNRAKDGHCVSCKACHKDYNKSEKGKAKAKRSNQSIKTKAAKKRYAQTEKGKTAQLRYNRTDKGKARNKRYRRTEKGKSNLYRGTFHYRTCHPERVLAHQVVRDAIKAGKLPRPNTLQCHYCPEKGKHYHHHKGYEPEHFLDVVAVCKKCHRKLHLK